MRLSAFSSFNLSFSTVSLVSQNEFDLKERYMRPDMLPLYHDKIEFLASKKVGVIGTGGAGGLCILLLSLAGVGTLHIADGDVVALHNLHRQILFNEGDINQSKAHAAAREVRSHQSKLNLKVFDYMIDETNFDEFSQDLDLIMDLTDNAASRLKISKLCLDKGIDLISGAVSAYTSLMGIYEYSNKDFVKKHGCYRCVTAGDNINTKVGITGPIANTCATLSAHLCLEYILGNREHVGKLVVFDFKGINTRKLNLCRDPNCKDCSNH